MFRRREDGSEEPINESGHTEGSSAPAAASSASAPAAATTAASAPSAPAAQPSFRPVPPQAAMAANRVPAMPAMPQQGSMASESSRTASAPITRPASSAANAKRVLTVGPDIQMKGEITSCDRVVIEGMVDATMRDVHTVELSESGALKGTAEVEDAEISGAFEGDLTVRGKLTVYASGRVRGNVTYGEIEIQRGGQISGNIRNIADAKAGNNPQQKKAA